MFSDVFRYFQMFHDVSRCFQFLEFFHLLVVNFHRTRLLFFMCPVDAHGTAVTPHYSRTRRRLDPSHPKAQGGENSTDTQEHFRVAVVSAQLSVPRAEISPSQEKPIFPPVEVELCSPTRPLCLTSSVRRAAQPKKPSRRTGGRFHISKSSNEKAKQYGWQRLFLKLFDFIGLFIIFKSGRNAGFGTHEQTDLVEW